MKIKKWVDMGQEVEVEIGSDDIRSALAEAFENITRYRFGEEGPDRNDIEMTLAQIGQFFNALTNEQIEMLNSSQRILVADFLRKQLSRFEV